MMQKIIKLILYYYSIKLDETSKPKTYVSIFLSIISLFSFKLFLEIFFIEQLKFYSKSLLPLSFILFFFIFQIIIHIIYREHKMIEIITEWKNNGIKYKDLRVKVYVLWILCLILFIASFVQIIG